MRRNLRQALFGATLAGLAVSDAVLAQQVAPSAGALEEIVVTARRREENIQSVPVAITAFSADDLREKAIISPVDLANQTPAYTQNSFQGRDSVLTPHLRSLPGVRTYFAEVPAAIAGLGNFYDLQNVQVLLGPQGTLFGLNATGGAVLREPKRPTDRFEGFIQGSFGSYNQRQVEGAVNVPLLEDKVMVRLAGDRQVRDGFTKRLGSDEKWDDRNYYSYRAAITVKPWEGVENYLVYNVNSSSTNGSSYFMLASNPRLFASQIFGQATLDAQIAQQRALGTFTSIGATFPDQFQKSKSRLLVDILTADLSDSLTFKNIASRGSSGSVSNYDEDGSPLPILDLYSPDKRLSPASVVYTEEPQLQARLFADNLNLVMGAFYSYTETPNPDERCTGFANFGALPNCQTTDNKSRTQALFGQATYNLGQISDALDGLKFTAGYRYNWDFTSQWTKGVNRTTRACTNAAADRNCVVQQTGKWKAPGWTFALDYQVQPDTLVYATVRRAYSTGLLNASTLPDSLRVVRPEFNTDVEIGVKSDFEIGETKFRSDIALFRNWYQDIQQLTTAVFTDAQGVTRSTGITENAAKAKILGADLQLRVVPADWIDFSFNYQYLMAKYNRFTVIDSVTLRPLDLSSRGFPFAPKHTGSVNARLHLPIDRTLGEATVGANVFYMSKLPLLPDGAPYSVNPARAILDLRADWNNVAGYPIDLGLSITNVTQKKYAVSTLNTWSTLGLMEIVYAEPRAFVAQIRYRFGD